MNNSTKKPLLSRADLLVWMDITPAVYRKLVEAKILKPVRMRGLKKRWFRRTDVVKALQSEEQV